MAYLLDTNVASELTKSRPHPAVSAWLEAAPGPALYLSVLVVGEIRQGIERVRDRDPVKAAVFESWLTRLEHGFADRIVPVDLKVARQWGLLNAKATLPVVDGLLAATALAYGWTLVTRNTKDFARASVPLLDPFAWPVGS
ncbi:type II toxin-antitoxin system VapC family toxin [Streptosporangiaceae bacterium NEAU-GS5]|nr:type II toxin-antitoxin system VapC family toxin [Streptosporangiaceae bacterium NEAU-GS5]